MAKFKYTFKLKSGKIINRTLSPSGATKLGESAKVIAYGLKSMFVLPKKRK